MRQPQRVQPGIPMVPTYSGATCERGRGTANTVVAPPCRGTRGLCTIFFVWIFLLLEKLNYDNHQFFSRWYLWWQFPCNTCWDIYYSYLTAIDIVSNPCPTQETGPRVDLSWINYFCINKFLPSLRYRRLSSNLYYYSAHGRLLKTERVQYHETHFAYFDFS